MSSAYETTFISSLYHRFFPFFLKLSAMSFVALNATHEKNTPIAAFFDLD